MRFKELLVKHSEDKTPLFVNEAGVGKITTVGEDYIEFEVIQEKSENKQKKLLKENILIQTCNIVTVSEGEKEIAKTETEKKIDKDLEGL